MTVFIEQANSIFEQPAWLDIVAPGQWSEAIVKEGSETIARLPYVLKHGAIVMPPFTQTLGPWIARKYRIFQRGNSQFRQQKEIIAELLSQLPNYKSFNMVFDSSNNYILPYRWHDFSFVPGFSYRINDLDDIEAVYVRFGKTVLKNIKTARHKVQIVESKNAEKMIELQNYTFALQGRKNPLKTEIVSLVINGSINGGFGKLLLAEDADGNIHAGAFLIYDNKVCYYLFGGSHPDFKSGGAQSLVLWDAIRFATSVSEKFDFEGSMVEGIETFFRQFGGTQVVNYRVMKNNLLEDLWTVCKPRIKKIIGYKN